MVYLQSAPKISPPDPEFRHEPGSPNAWVEDFDNAVRALDKLRSKSLATFDNTSITPEKIKDVTLLLVDVCSYLVDKESHVNPADPYPFNADDEREYTTMVKQRRLYEGACELRWQDYFAYREANACPPLTEDDLLYLGQWTVCPA